MVWCKKNKLIFIHIPKTGGTTIEEYLNLFQKCNGYGDFNGKSLQHLIGSDIKELLGDDFNNFFRFTIVRNPIDRAISEYYWNEIGHGFKNGKSFDEFLDIVEEKLKGNCQKTYLDHYLHQSKFIYDKNNNILVDKIFRFENFDKIEEFMLKNYKNNSNKFEKKNVGLVRKKNEIKLTVSQKARIYKIYKDDFINFNYQIDEEIIQYIKNK